ncbi:MAG: diaminopimelate epimerase [Bacteroidales bacterium]|nr:diaminopimelate epimerase [Bacteroidales bacterium]
MLIDFYKYHGTANDFVIIDNRSNWFDNSKPEIIKKLCDRRIGIGADGLMLLQNNPDFDFEMKYFNSDGLEGSMCGNGGRCITAFAKKLNIISETTEFLAVDGVHLAEIKGEMVKLKMNDVSEIKPILNGYFLNTGSPHYVEFIENIEIEDFFEKGKALRFSKEFAPSGTNVNFLTFQKGMFKMRTYERGVENETLSCGTGTVASALVAAFKDSKIQSPLLLSAPGGNLKVYFKRNSSVFFDVWLEGPASFVFQGSIII